MSGGFHIGYELENIRFRELFSVNAAEFSEFECYKIKFRIV